MHQARVILGLFFSMSGSSSFYCRVKLKKKSEGQEKNFCSKTLWFFIKKLKSVKCGMNFANASLNRFKTDYCYENESIFQHILLRSFSIIWKSGCKCAANHRKNESKNRNSQDQN